ncbi:MAG TPA: carboxypeptidase-like regulatory domain-containing protein, partial [Pyrinomonadaceae bacterium]|nr:carboxypeptidase-like regulatory domain-containing protein [Pyrinomonadaceae bacterium]
MRTRNPISLFWTTCFLALYSISVFPQSQTTGRIVGTIKDQNDASIVGAEVTVKSLATSEERKVITDAQGAYAALLLSPGSYRVTVTSNGFKRAEIESVRVVITETAKLDVGLEVGDISDQAVVM